MAIRRFRWSRRRLAALVILAVLVGTVLFYPLPYFLKSPGGAESLRGRVTVADHPMTVKGDFLFTTVLQLIKPSLAQMLYVRLTEDYTETVPADKAIGNVKNIDAYNQLTDWMRVDSEASAVMAAHKYLDRPLKVENQGVIIRSFLPDSPASKQLHEGDILAAADGHPVQTVADLAAAVKNKTKGETLALQVRRGKQTLNVTVPLTELSSENGAPRLGIGIYYEQVRKAFPTTPIQFKLEDIGGPSAGLMLTLDIISKLEGKDYSRGYSIAGTGTIDAEGNVGQIGGIRYKLVGASRTGADYFLVPKDPKSASGNQKEAEEFLRTYQTSMKLVPVATLKEAADFLASLPEK